MISLDEVEKTILELESKDTSYAVCEKLAYLYIVRDHIKPNGSVEVRTEKSDFLRTVSKKETVDVIEVIDELMQTVSVVHPKLYEATMQELKRL